ncbi:uncharacterized protein AMSG_01748 [Thecamonas trahens ATCC 50062]|uniref:Uncharacterized protein n=1 Tax=Thecamonas trahens ATCC 50062 TaxID=461836 RepID=A0A0L0DT05_THETB|nr:hypothetical protein AMSG_01748 [Thecamonas trahens ATCC 50062]KNC55484.1 hypothetical protein AMSG_01748 [Thecamonas trahens ATCC 50062]|eukprot:XP_013761264.1 hypothetical protein AMSG_01748 [Thecamonas trahens ATCC 50062]
MQRVKVVAVGDDGVGKTSLFTTYGDDAFPHDFVAPIQDWCIEVVHESPESGTEPRPIILALFDTPGGDKYDSLRPLGYVDTDVFLLCYSVASRASFDRIAAKFADTSDSERSVTFQDGQALADSIAAVAFVEIAAKSHIASSAQRTHAYPALTTVPGLIHFAIETAIASQPSPPPPRKCIIV